MFPLIGLIVGGVLGVIGGRFEPALTGTFVGFIAGLIARSGGLGSKPPAMAALRQPVDLKRWLLWGALGFATLVLAWMAHALARQMRAPSPNATSNPPKQESP